MTFNNAAKPADWCYLRTGVLANGILDADLVAGNVVIPWTRADGPIIDTFASGSIADNTRIPEEGPINTFWRTWPSGSGAWSISGGAAVWAGAGRGVRFNLAVTCSG
jgi:hypothetical protein